MKNLLYKSMFFLLACRAVTSFGMEPHRRSATEALEQQKNNKIYFIEFTIPYHVNLHFIDTYTNTVYIYEPHLKSYWYIEEIKKIYEDNNFYYKELLAL